MGDLDGKKAIITGGGRGFGRATALQLAALGADVAISYRSARDEAEWVRERVEDMGRRCFVAQSDVSDNKQAAEFVRQALDSLGGLDILVNNAGMRHIGPFAEQQRPLWADMINTNVYGVLTTTHEALPALVASGAGRIVNIASQMAHGGADRFAIYSGTKAFILAFTKSLAREVGPSGITVNAVCPGSIVTDMNRVNYTPELQAKRAAELPLRRLGDPDDIGAAVAFLVSPRGAFITGQCINVNGGATM